MTLAYANSFFPTLDRALSEDAREVRKIGNRHIDFGTSISIGLPKEKIISRLIVAFRDAIEDNWDGYQALQADPNTISYALYFLSQLPSSLPLPEIGIDNDGEVAIEWDYGPRNLISIRVGRDGSLNYAGLVGPAVFHGSELLSDGIPDIVLLGIERVARVPAA